MLLGPSLVLMVFWPYVRQSTMTQTRLQLRLPKAVGDAQADDETPITPPGADSGAGTHAMRSWN